MKAQVRRAAPFVLAASAALALSSPASAGQLDDMVQAFQNAGASWHSTTLPYGLLCFRLLASLEALMTIYALVFLFFSGKLTGGGIVGTALRKIIFFGFFILTLQFFPLFAPKLISTFQDTGAHIAGVQGINPSSVFDQGLYMGLLVLNTFNNAATTFIDIPQAILCAFLALLLMGCFTVLAFSYAQLLVKSTLLLSGGVFFLGFGANRLTIAMAENYLVALTRLGIHFFWLIFFVAVSATLFPYWQAQLLSPIQPSINGFFPILNVTGQALIFTLLAVRLPKELAYELTAPTSFFHLRQALVGDA
jgi:P-type conjugative transfer protein TrbL